MSARTGIAVAVALALMSATLAGCQLLPATAEPAIATPEPTATWGPPATDAPPPGVTPVVFWEPFSLDREAGILLLEMVRDFEAENPDVQVELVAKSGYEGIYNGILAELPGGDLPDLAAAFPSMIADIAAVGWVIPLEPYLYDLEFGLTDEEMDDLYPGALEGGRFPAFGGQMLGFPFTQNVVGMWVNRTLLAKAGWDRPPATWSEFEQACWDVWAATGYACYPFIESVSTFDAWLLSRGGQQLDEAGLRATFNQPAGVESLALLRRLLDAGLAWRPAELYGNVEVFANGQSAFAFSATSSGPLYLDAYDGALQRGNAPFAWEQTLLPQADPDQPATALYGSSFFILAADPERQQAAWRLIRWFTDTSQTARWAGGLQSMPARVSALNVMTDTLETYPFMRKQVEDILPYGQPEPALAAELEVRAILHTAILSVTQGISETQAALDQAARDVDALLGSQP